MGWALKSHFIFIIFLYKFNQTNLNIINFHAGHMFLNTYQVYCAPQQSGSVDMFGQSAKSANNLILLNHDFNINVF